jgi:ATP-dependent protease Clp ATPase subunit
MTNLAGRPTIVFVDEFDKLFISGNTNSEMAHESTNGVQNEFLKVLESGQAAVFGDYGKYINVSTEKVLFVFAGAFNGEEDIDLDRLRELGIKTEFLGRVGITYSTTKLSLNDMYAIIEDSQLLKTYLELFDDVAREDVINVIKELITDGYENNTIGARMINTLIHQYFIQGGLPKKEAKKISFQKKMSINS